jgi:hypothetical protein
MTGWVREQNLLIPGPVHESADPDQLADEISLIASLRSFDSLIGNNGFLHRSSMLLVGDIAVTSAAFLPQQGETFDSSQALVELPISPNAGTSFLVEGKPWECLPHQQGLFLPGQAMQAITESASCMLGYNLQPELLANHLHRLAPERFNPVRARLFVQRPHPINLRDGRIKRLLTWFLAFLNKLGQPDVQNGLPPGLIASSYEPLIYRATALMLCPELIQSSA